MKIFILALAVGAISCGKYDTLSSKTGTVGAVKSLSPVTISQIERVSLTSVCNALSQKNSVLTSSSGAAFSFQAQQSDCSGNIVSSGVVNVTLQGNGQNFVFKKTDGTDFIFPEVETNTSGMMAEVCGSIQTASNPIQVGQDYLFVSTSVNSADCPPASGEVCVQVEKASLNNGQAQVYTTEIMRVRTQSGTNSLIGFFTFRKKYTRAYCGSNEAISLQATLK